MLLVTSPAGPLLPLLIMSPLNTPCHWNGAVHSIGAPSLQGWCRAVLAQLICMCSNKLKMCVRVLSGALVSSLALASLTPLTIFAFTFRCISWSTPSKSCIFAVVIITHGVFMDRTYHYIVNAGEILYWSFLRMSTFDGVAQLPTYCFGMQLAISGHGAGAWCQFHARIGSARDWTVGLQPSVMA